ncbi:MAG TPA: Vms1/Ankzf1 family peptidyl-tRNA hydrolase, partial [Actinomycetota bacterium]|nr:Vms1/Ankzf1 family peptidyl-tRNA hydrolase [Actinomycetota bacterium]
MEGRASMQAAVTAPDLVDVVNSRGPFLTLYLPTYPEIENAAQKVEATWKAARQEMESAGVPQAVLAAIEPLIPDAHQRGRCLAVVATGSGVLHVEHGPIPPATHRFRWAPLPSLTTLLEWRQAQPPHVVVLTDTTGADLVAYRGERPIDSREAGIEEHAISKVSPGGWSQRRFQQRAENTWEDNADAAAEEVSAMAKQVNASLVVAAGDPRALQLLQEALPKEIADLFHVVEGGRSAGADKDAVEGEARQLVSVLVAQETEKVVERFREERGQEDLAAEGAPATLEALSRAQVDTLLITDDWSDERTAWFGPDATHASADEAPLRDL